MEIKTLMAQDVRDIAAKAIRETGADVVNREYLAALAKMESGLDPYATRYEPYFYDSYIQGLGLGQKYRVGRCSVQTEEVNLATSFGLFQIMGVVARERNCRLEFLTHLLDPAVNAHYACLHFKWMADQFETKDLFTLAVCWNGGNPASRAGARFAERLMEAYQDEIDLKMSRDAGNVERAVRMPHVSSDSLRD